MAMQVDLSSVLPSLAISELRNEVMLQHSFLTSLSPTGPKDGEQPGPLALLILEDRKQREALMRPATASPSPLRARLTPKPFSREKTSDSFAMVKPPVPAPRPSSDLSKPSAFTQTLGEAVKGPAGNVPPLLDQSSSGHEIPREVVANVPFSSNLQANPVILFEGRNTDKARPEGTLDKVGDFLKIQEGQLFYSRLETSSRRPFSWNPLGNREACLGAPEDSAGQEESPTLASKGQLEPRERPGSGAVPEAWKGPMQPAPPTQKPACEKSWARNPRPLSMDLTARFEKHGRGKSLSGQLTDVDPCGPGGKSGTQLAESPSGKGQAARHPPLTLAREVAPLGQSPPEDLGQTPTKERRAVWELHNQGSLNSEEGDAGAKELSACKGWAFGERAQVTPGSAADTSEVKSLSFGGSCTKKAFPVPAALAGAPAPTGSDAFPEGCAKESRMTNIQQRIKELTAENTDPKPANLGRSFRSRPLSSELTKLFSGPATVSELKHQQLPQKDRKSDTEEQETQEDQVQPLCGTDSRKACLGGPPWKPQPLGKTSSKEGPPEGESSAAKGQLRASLQGEPPPLVLSTEAKRHSLQPQEEACIKTVRATIFEHPVQRHHVVTNHLAAKPPLQNEFLGETLVQSRGLRLERVPGTVASAQGSLREADAEPEDLRPVTEEKASLAGAKCTAREEGEEAAPRPAEGSLLDQWIEPRYEILQTVGERVQSEAIAGVLEEKAVTLRRGRSLRERKSSDGGAATLSQPCGFGGKRDGWREDPKPAPETSLWTGLPAFWSQRGSHRQELGLGSHWTACVKAASSRRMKESWQMDGRVSLEAELEERDAPASRSEGAHPTDHFPEQAVVGPCGTGASGSRASTVGQKMTSSLTSGSKRQWQRLGHPGLCSGVDPKPACEPEEPQGGGQKTSPTTFGDDGMWNGSGRLTGDHQFQPLEVEDQRKRRLANGSAPRVLERWRRKTVPHEAARPEEVLEPPQNPARPVGRRDSWHRLEGSVSQRSPQTQRGVDPSHLKKQQLSSSEPKATYFAVTYQVSNEIDKVPGKAALGSLGTSNSRRADRSAWEGSPDRPLGWSRGGLPGKGASEYPPREGAWELLGREPGADRGRAAAADPPLCTAQGSSSHVVPLRRDNKLAGQQRSGPAVLGGAEEQVTGRYRSRAIDIDELMVEYGVDSRKEPGKGDRKEHRYLGESSLLSGSPQSHFCSLREPSPGSRRPGSAPGGKGSDRVQDGGPLQSCDWEPGLGGDRDGKFSPPCWARPETEKAKPVGAKNKTFFLGQEQREGLWPGPQRAKDASSRPLAAHRLQMDLGAEASPSSGGDLWKDVSLKRPATSAQGRCASRDLSGGTEGKVGVPRRAWEKAASPVAQARAEQSSATPGSLGPAAAPDVQGSASDQALPTTGAPLGLEARLRPDWHPVHHSSARVRLEDQLSKDHRTPGGSSPDRKGDFERGRPKQDGKDLGAGCAPSLLKQRRSHSFYRERRRDHWPGDQLKQCLGHPPAEAGDSEVPVREGAHSRESLAPESPSSESSPAPARLQPPSSSSSSLTGGVSTADRRGSAKGRKSTSPDGSSLEDESAEGAKASLPAGACLDFAFLEQTPVLDSGALKSRALLSKRRRQPRAPSSYLLRRSPAGGADPPPEEALSPWMFKDSTELKSTEGEDSGRDERSLPAERPSSSQTPRRPMFPGVDPSALKAQLRKRRDSEEGPPAPLSKSPKGHLPAGVAGGQGPGAAPEKEGRSPEPRSPQWLQELKSKKKQSQAERPA